MVSSVMVYLPNQQRDIFPEEDVEKNIVAKTRECESRADDRNQQGGHTDAHFITGKQVSPAPSANVLTGARGPERSTASAGITADPRNIPSGNVTVPADSPLHYKCNCTFRTLRFLQVQANTSVGQWCSKACRKQYVSEGSAMAEGYCGTKWEPKGVCGATRASFRSSTFQEQDEFGGSWYDDFEDGSGVEWSEGMIFNDDNSVSPVKPFHRKCAISVSGSARVLNDYQLKIAVPHDPDMQADFDDLRFYDSDMVGELA